MDWQCCFNGSLAYKTMERTDRPPVTDHATYASQLSLKLMSLLSMMLLLFGTFTKPYLHTYQRFPLHAKQQQQQQQPQSGTSSILRLECCIYMIRNAHTANRMLKRNKFIRWMKSNFENIVRKHTQTSVCTHMSCYIVYEFLQKKTHK